MAGLMGARVLLLTTACSGPTGATLFEGMSDDGEIHYVLDFAEPPPVGFAEAVVDVAEATGAPLAGIDLAVTAWMPQHGHGSAEPTTIEDLGDGSYEAVIGFSMAGTWEVTLEVDGEHDWIADVLVE